ncbi:MAG: fumarate hydratase [Ignavibacteriales bacterium]|nr:fumarate hydratase [Ignavibacteriales bacterium]
MKDFRESMLTLITDASTNLPPDVRRAVATAQQRETPDTRASLALDTIGINIDMACDNTGAICQDTGMLSFYIHTPRGTDQLAMREQILDAIAEATKRGILRPNSVDSLTGKNSGNNLGPGTPVIHWEQWDRPDEIEVKLLLKGGGCENKNIQYSLPAQLDHVGKAGRNLDGVRKCLLHAVWQAQGHGCSIGALGVCIGGDRTSSNDFAKQQLFRKLDDTNPVPALDELERYIMDRANRLKIGTMGFGGESTLIGCKIGVLNRLPASFFVSVAYDCWAFRRQGVVVDASTGSITQWLYKDAVAASHMADHDQIALTGKERRLQTPISDEAARSLSVGDVVLLSGTMYTGRDALHAHLIDHDSPVDLKGQVIYHCGPVILKDGDGWIMKAAGPTTSSREEPYQADIIKKFGIRAVVGKGGMGARTLAALKEHGAVYLNAIGGAAQFYARCVEKIEGVHFPEFGVPEAMWELKIKDFPAIVTMDAHGNSLHADVEKASADILATFADGSR